MDVSTAAATPRMHGSGTHMDLFSSEHDSNVAATRRQECVTAGFSLVIDDVDGELDEPFPSESAGGCSRIEDDTGEESQDLSQDSSPADKEKSDARIQQIKGEAEIRKNQFAQLLEEHAQIMQRIKQMEEGPSMLQGAEMGPTEV